MADEDDYSMKIEAEEVIKEIKFAVKSVELSQILHSVTDKVYFNLETKESCKFCVELTPRGFRLSGKQFDRADEPEDGCQYHETIYSLLDSISPGYRNTFSDALIQKLQGLQDQSSNESPGS